MEIRDQHPYREISISGKVPGKDGITTFSPKETDQLNVPCLEDDGEIMATGSIAGNVLKYIAVLHVGQGETFNQLAQWLTRPPRWAFHLRLHQAAVRAKLYVGFHVLAQVEDGAIL